MDQRPKEVTDPREMRQIIDRLAYCGQRMDGKGDFQHSIAASLAANVLMTGKVAGLSHADTMTMLAYHALLAYEKAMDRLIEQVMLNTPRLLVQESNASAQKT